MDRLRALRDDDDGFTLIELMVVLVIISVLVALALPVFLGAQERAKDRAAQADLRTGLAAAKAVYSSTGDYTGVTTVEMEDAEPTMVFVSGATASSNGNDYAVSFRVWNGGEVDMARLSSSGDCYYLRAIEQQGTAPEDVPSTYMGWASVACTGNAVAAFVTGPVCFPGW
jgi:type IV pilus assembly protein PilA